MSRTWVVSERLRAAPVRERLRERLTSPASAGNRLLTRAARGRSNCRYAVLTLLLCAATAAAEREPYRLGPGDEVVVAAIGAPEISGERRRVDPGGELRLPLIGTVRAEGRTASELEAAIEDKLARYLKNPRAAVALAEVGSRPVSVLGAVRNPGVLQLGEGRTLLETLSAAGGPAVGAGDRITLTRRAEHGAPALPGAALDESGAFYVARIDARALLDSDDPSLNIPIRAHDVITVRAARRIYVIGAVNRPGVFPLLGESTSVLEALAMAGGLGRRAKSKRARILSGESPEARRETPVDLKSVVAGRAPDRPMAAGDILFVPVSGSKVAAAELARAALTIGTGAAIWTAVR